MMVRIGMIGIAAILLAMPLRKEKGEFALLLVLAAGMLIFAYSLARIQTVLVFLTDLIESLPMETKYLTPLFKMLGITYVADFAASLQGIRVFVRCRTNGTFCKTVHYRVKYTGTAISGGCVGEFFVDEKLGKENNCDAIDHKRNSWGAAESQGTGLCAGDNGRTAVE